MRFGVTKLCSIAFLLGPDMQTLTSLDTHAPAPLTCRPASSLVLHLQMLQTSVGYKPAANVANNPVQGPQRRQGEGGGLAVPGAGGP